MTVKAGFQKLLGRFSVKLKLMSVPAVLILAIAAVVASTVTTLEGMGTDKLVLDVLGLQRVLSQRYMKELTLYSLQGDDKLSYTRKVFTQDLEALTNGGTAIVTLAKEDTVQLDNGGTAIVTLGKEDTVQLPPPPQQLRARLLEQNRLMGELFSKGNEFKKLDPSDTPYYQKLKELSDTNEAFYAGANQADKLFTEYSQSKLLKTIKYQLILSAIAAIAALIFSWSVGAGILTTVSEATRVAAAVAAGDLTTKTKTDYSGNDELAKLSATINNMTHELATMKQDLIDAREGALASSRAKSEFLSSMSHEIRTPMNAVLGMAELLLDSELSAEQRRYLDIMVANGNSLLGLINNILDMAKIESGRLEVDKTEFELTELIDETISGFGVRAHGKGLELAARIAPGVPERLVGDPLRLRQVLVNLIGNAIKFTELGEVVLNIEQDPESHQPGRLLFSVSDTGIGIPKDKLDSLFADFTQVDSSTTRRYGGTGLGLAIAKRLVDLMGGRIWVESELDKGSKFSFTAQLELAPHVITPKAQGVQSLAGYRILIVDDNENNRLIAREMVTNRGAEVAEAASGPEAIDAVRSAADAGRPYRIILLDMRMPGMDGLEVAKRIQQEKLPIRPVVLMLSSDDLKIQVNRLKEFALDAYLVKPITRKELLGAIRRIVNDPDSKTAEALSACAAEEKIAHAQVGKILAVDDSPDNRLLIAALLRREPYQLEFAEDGQQAFDKFTSDHYDLVLMDMLMPKVDGLTATGMMRKWEKDHGAVPTPIIALTASALQGDVARALDAGCDGHLAKPIKKILLVSAIRSVIDSKKNGKGMLYTNSEQQKLTAIDRQTCPS